MARFHPTDEWLANYASGSTDEHFDILIASHLNYCPQCRDAVARHEEIAGALLDLGLDDSDDAEDDFALVLRNAKRAIGLRSPLAPLGTFSRIAPRILSDYVYGIVRQSDVESFGWSEHHPGIKRLVLAGDQNNPIARLVQAQPGSSFPLHSHDSEELSLVLTGAYCDDTGRYATGDVQCAPAGISHQPTVEEGDVCFVLIVSGQSC